MASISFYQVIVLLHIFFAFCLFSLWVTEFVFILSKHRQKVAQRIVERLQMISMLIVLGTGFYLMRVAWGPKQWLTMSVILLLCVIPVNLIVTRRAVKAERAGDDALETYFRLTASAYKILTAVFILSLMVLKNLIESKLIYVMPFAYTGLAICLFAVYRPKSRGI